MRKPCPEWRCDLCEATGTRPWGHTARERAEDPWETVPQAGWNIKQVDGKHGIVTLVLSGARAVSLTSAGLTGLRNLEERSVRTLKP